MKIPFTIDQFLEVFKDYNKAVFPMQVVLLLLAIAAVVLAIRNLASNNKIIAAILAFFWLWMGIGYHFLFFSTINKAAYLFGVLFIVQGILFLIQGLKKQPLTYRFEPGIKGWIGSLFIIYALVIYPILGFIDGHEYPYSPTFGLPCPTTIFTFGLLMWTPSKVPWTILVIPFLWSIIGFFAAVSLGIIEDIGLLVAGVTAILALSWQNRTIDSYQ